MVFSHAILFTHMSERYRAGRNDWLLHSSQPQPARRRVIARGPYHKLRAPEMAAAIGATFVGVLIASEAFRLGFGENTQQKQEPTPPTPTAIVTPTIPPATQVVLVQPTPTGTKK